MYEACHAIEFSPITSAKLKCSDVFLCLQGEKGDTGLTGAAGARGAPVS